MPQRGPGYAESARQPFTVLLFLLPLILLYEIGSLRFLSDPAHGVTIKISASSLVQRFFDAFGAAGLHLPAIVLVVVLLIWQVTSRQPWKAKPLNLLGMWIESAALTCPLLVIGSILAAKVSAAGGVSQDQIQAMPWQARAILAIGAGLYEELLFRLVLITAFHMILVDLIRLPDRAGKILSVLVTGLLFALYHDLSKASGSGIDFAKLAFFLVAGWYFGALFLVRGFGIAVAVHALYDIVVLLWHPR